MGIEKQIISARLDDDTLDKLKRICEKENRSLSNLIETILKRYLHESDVFKEEICG